MASNKFLTVFKESSYNFHSKSDNVVPVDLKIMYTIFEMPPELVPFWVSGYSSYAGVISLSLNLEAGVGREEDRA